MDVITIETKAFQRILTEIEEIKNKIFEDKKKTVLEDDWLDNQDVCQLLRISKRQLQHYRDSGLMAFSQIGAKIYYKASFVQEFLQNHYRPSTAKNL